MAKMLKQLWADEQGATMVEYALMVALVGVILVATVTAFKGSIGDAFTRAKTGLDNAK